MNRTKMIFIIAALCLVIITGGVMASGYLTRNLVGTMEYAQLEGGFWTVVSDGEQFIPINLEEKHMVEGLKVRFTVVERPDIVGIHMVGTYVEIVE